jgi:hypothetical protein
LGLAGENPVLHTFYQFKYPLIQKRRLL